MDGTKVEIILGCMMAGKTTEMVRRISRYEAIGKNTLIINSNLDTRTGDSVKTHNNETKKALKTLNLMDIVETDEYATSDIIGLDEAQFFKDLKKFVLYSEKTKTIIISGLDGDSNREPFGQILECIPLCDNVTKLTALDMISKDGSAGIFSKRIINDNQQIFIGSSESFLAVSRKNYFT